MEIVPVLAPLNVVIACNDGTVKLLDSNLDVYYEVSVEGAATCVERVIGRDSEKFSLADDFNDKGVEGAHGDTLSLSFHTYTQFIYDFLPYMDCCYFSIYKIGIL